MVPSKTSAPAVFFPVILPESDPVGPAGACSRNVSRSSASDQLTSAVNKITGDTPPNPLTLRNPCSFTKYFWATLAHSANIIGHDVQKTSANPPQRAIRQAFRHG